MSHILRYGSLVFALFVGQGIAADKQDKFSSSANDPAPQVTRPITRINQPKSVAETNPDLRDNMRIDLGGRRLPFYSQNSVALNQLKQKIRMLESKLTDLDRFASAQSLRIQRCVSASYSDQEVRNAGCASSSIGECSRMLVVNCMGGANSMNRTYDSYARKLRETDRSAEDVQRQYRELKRSIGSALAALGPVSTDSEDSSLEFNWNVRD